MWRGNTGKVPALGIKLPKQTVQIFNCAFSPGAIWVGKIDFTMESLFNLKPVGKLRTPSTSNGLDQLRGKDRQCSNNSGFHCLGFSARYLHGNVKPSLALCQSGKAGFAFALAAHCRTRFTSTGFLTAVYRLVSFSGRLPFAVFPSCFFRSPWLFPLRRSTFRLPFIRCFSQLHRQMVRQPGICNSQGTRAICSGDQVAFNLPFMQSITSCEWNIPQ